MSRMHALVVASIAAGLGVAQGAQAIIVLDDFSVAQSNSTQPAINASSMVAGPLTSIFGGTRTTTVVKTGGAGRIDSEINTTTPMTLDFSSSVNTDGTVKLDYSSAATDITPGAVGLSGQLAGDLGGATFTLTIDSLGGGTSSNIPLLIVPSGTAGVFSPFNIPFASLVGNVDLTKVTGVHLLLDGQKSFDGQLRLLQFDVPPSGVPEPGAMALLVGTAGMGGAMLRRRRK